MQQIEAECFEVCERAFELLKEHQGYAEEMRPKIEWRFKEIAKRGRQVFDASTRRGNDFGLATDHAINFSITAAVKVCLQARMMSSGGPAK